MKNELLRAERVMFGYGKEPLFENLSFFVKEGEIMAVIGANGAGKTTLLNCLTGALKLKSGSVFVQNRPLSSFRTKELYEILAYVPQRSANVLSYTVLESVLFGLTGSLGVFGTPGKKEQERAEETLEKLSVAHLAKKQLNELSGGELQMVRIAGALVKQPKLLILDEPETGLDYRNQLLVLDAIEKLKHENVSCIFNTHYPEHAFRVSDTGILFRKDERTPLFLPIRELLTEENVRKALGVTVAIGEINADDNELKFIVPIKISSKE